MEFPKELPRYASTRIIYNQEKTQPKPSNPPPSGSPSKETTTASARNEKASTIAQSNRTDEQDHSKSEEENHPPDSKVRAIACQILEWRQMEIEYEKNLKRMSLN
jgi:hypothetical protein